MHAKFLVFSLLLFINFSYAQTEPSILEENPNSRIEMLQKQLKEHTQERPVKELKEPTNSKQIKDDVQKQTNSRQLPDFRDNIPEDGRKIEEKSIVDKKPKILQRPAVPHLQAPVREKKSRIAIERKDAQGKVIGAPVPNKRAPILKGRARHLREHARRAAKHLERKRKLKPKKDEKQRRLEELKKRNRLKAASNHNLVPKNIIVQRRGFSQ